jgi:hypothetical protein
VMRAVVMRVAMRVAMRDDACYTELEQVDGRGGDDAALPPMGATTGLEEGAPDENAAGPEHRVPDVRQQAPI